MKFPKNILISLPHASYRLPDNLYAKLSQEFCNNEFRLLKNFSDFGTNSLISSFIPENQIVRAEYSRAIGDQNRDLDADDFLRKVDFNNIPVWKTPLNPYDRAFGEEKSYCEFHDDIQQKIDTDRFDLLVDIHDTGNWLLGGLKKDDKKRQPAFVDICISNADGETCSDELLFAFAKALERETSYSVSLNTPYKGGFITRHYGAQISTIQVEINRSLYMDEITQVVDNKKAAKLAEALYEAICSLKDAI